MNPVPARSRRAIVLRRPEADDVDLERLIREHRLEVVFTVVTDTAVPKLAALIAVQHVLEYGAEVVVLPHLSRDRVRGDSSWGVVSALAVVVTSSGEVGCAAFSP